MATSEIPPHRIGILPITGFGLLPYAATVEPFRAANRLSGKVQFELLHFTTGGRTASDGAAEIEVEYGVGDTPFLDALIVIAGPNAAGFQDRLTLRWLRRMARDVRLMAGVDAGAMVLARAELLGGRAVTVRPDMAQDLAWIAPAAQIWDRPSVFDRDRATARDGAAAAELAELVIAARLGAPQARRAMTAAFGDQVHRPVRDERNALPLPLQDARAAMQAHIADPLSLEDVARWARVSPRQLNRLFQMHTRSSAMGFYRMLRLDHARALIEHTRLPLTEIALATGFANSAHFSTAFTKAFGQAPSSVRRKGAQAG